MELLFDYVVDREWESLPESGWEEKTRSAISSQDWEWGIKPLGCHVVDNNAVQSGSYVKCIALGDYWLTFSSIWIPGYLKILKNTESFQHLPWQPDKQTEHDIENLQRASWDLHQIWRKNNIYIYICIYIIYIYIYNIYIYINYSRRHYFYQQWYFESYESSADPSIII